MDTKQIAGVIVVIALIPIFLIAMSVIQGSVYKSRATDEVGIANETLTGMANNTWVTLAHDEIVVNSDTVMWHNGTAGGKLEWNTSTRDTNYTIDFFIGQIMAKGDPSLIDSREQNISYNYYFSVVDAIDDVAAKTPDVANMAMIIGIVLAAVVIIAAVIGVAGKGF